ncbi:MAG: hypothetical protein ACRC0G_16045 [Fusobacteriaceae bacterium]
MKYIANQQGVKIEEKSGYIQNISSIRSVEVSTSVMGEGVIIQPGEKINFRIKNHEEIFITCPSGQAEVRVAGIFYTPIESYEIKFLSKDDSSPVLKLEQKNSLK